MRSTRGDQPHRTSLASSRDLSLRRSTSTYCTTPSSCILLLQHLTRNERTQATSCLQSQKRGKSRAGSSKGTLAVWWTLARGKRERDTLIVAALGEWIHLQLCISVSLVPPDLHVQLASTRGQRGKKSSIRVVTGKNLPSSPCIALTSTSLLHRNLASESYSSSQLNPF